MLKPFCVIFLSISLLRFSSTLSSSNTSCDPLHVAAFNIKVFGATKASKSGVMSVLANITQRYDVMLVQEIRDINMLAIYQLLDLVNSNLPDGDMYDISLSERTGRSSSKEQYCFFYRPSRVTVVSTHQFNDTENDYFEREPYSVLFQYNCTESVCDRFWLQAIHTKPTAAVSEIDSLYLYSFPDASTVFNTTRGMVLGDLNGDCSYVSDTAGLSLRFQLDSNFTFLLTKGEDDTTVSSTFCTYDNFLIHNDLKTSLVPDTVRIFNFMMLYDLTQDFALDVSDHYPIELELSQCPTNEIEPDTSSNTSCDLLHVAAFNIKVFGATKASKSDVMSVLANITQRYDVMLVQEIRDINMLAIYQLLDLVNSNLPDGDMYDISLSERTGRSSSKEQYCFFYRPSRVTVVSTHQFNDTENDYFEREPYSVLFQYNCTESVCDRFWLQAIHTKPTAAVSEIDSLYLYSFPDASTVFNTTRGMVLGDLNGDCSYVSDTAGLSLRFQLDSNFTFLLTKGEDDTTVSSTFCTYDNFLIHNDLKTFLIPNTVRIFNFMMLYNLTQDFALDVSDHYPIEIQLAFSCHDGGILINPNSASQSTLPFILLIYSVISIFFA